MSEGFSAAAEKAASALDGIDGGSELLASVTDFFNSAEETLQSITNEESAQAAASKLSEMGKATDHLTESGTLPDTARTAVGSLIEQGLAQLNALIEKINEMPLVADVIKPQLDAVLEKLKVPAEK